MTQDYQANKQPKEYWVNVYQTPYGRELGTVQHCFALTSSARKLLYRIHVKLKPVKKKYLIEQPTHILDKLNWMG